MFTPRKPKSGWSALNRTRVARLIKAGLMTEAGKRMVTLAKKTGTWEALASIDALELPADLKKAMDAKLTSKRTWATYSPAARKMVLYYLNDAKRPETRAKRIADIVGFVARNGSLADLRAGKIKL